MMKYIYLTPIGSIDNSILENLKSSLHALLPFQFKIAASSDYPQYAFESSRKQYYAKKIIERFSRSLPDDCLKMICITDVDLCAPVLTFVYGEAQLGGAVAVLSVFRLKQEFFSLRSDDLLLADRLTKECIHELGHCYGLFHCNDTKCVMFFSKNIINIDHKEKDFCLNCRDFFHLRLRGGNNDQK